jgi:zinc/manganese transport system permease protein
MLLASSVWLVVNPRADQPLLAAIEAATGWGPEPFLSAAERETLHDADVAQVRYRAEVERMNAIEREARVGPPLSDNDIRRLSSYSRSFNEMERGEQFVADYLRAQARESERWYIGLPFTVLSLAGLAWLAGLRRGGV